MPEGSEKVLKTAQWHLESAISASTDPLSRLVARSAVCSFVKKASKRRLRTALKGLCNFISVENLRKTAENCQKSLKIDEKTVKNGEKTQKTAEFHENPVKTAKMTKKVVGIGEKAEKPEKDDDFVDFGDPVRVAFLDGATGKVKCAVSMEVADTPERRARGLSKRASLPDGTGMVFDCRGPFWMKDVEFPLDLVFTDKAGVVTEKMAMSVDKSGGTLYSPSDMEAENAVELPLGFCDAHGIGKGDVISVDFE